jgi:hypothetical protein
MPNVPVRSASSMLGMTKAFDPIDAMHAPSRVWDQSQKEALDAIERRLANGGWDEPLGGLRTTMVDWPPSLPPRERLAAAVETIVGDRRAQMQRDEEMVRAMQAMEAAMVESAKREERALRRAEEAEAREVAARERSERREERLVRFAAASLIVAVLSFIVPAIT